MIIALISHVDTEIMQSNINHCLYNEFFTELFDILIFETS